MHYKSNQIKSLLLSHHHSTSALVSEILMSVLQTVQKKKIYFFTFTYGQYIFSYILTSPSDNSSSSSSSDSNPIWGSSSISTIVNEYSTGIRQINTVTEEFTTPPSFTCGQHRFSRVRVTLKPWRKQRAAEEWFRCWRTDLAPRSPGLWQVDGGA